MDKIIARFHCDTAAEKVNQYSPSYKPENIELSVVSGAKEEEDKIFYSSTPGGEVKLQIINVAAKGFFKPGKRYEAVFTELPE